ncbi:MAG: PEGA domain-containing protein [Patescibacteria group bacterium]
MFLIGISIIFYAHGYKFNFKNFKIIKTGIIYVSSEQREANLYVNGVLVAPKLPFAYGCLPGFYNLEIKKDGYQSWKSRIQVTAEKVSSFDYIVLFKNNISKEQTSDAGVINQLISPNDELFRSNNTIYYNDYEIWEGQNLVARFSKPINRAIWFSDNYHIIYQQGDEIRVIEKTGTNDTFLIRLENNAITNFDISSNGNELYFKDLGRYYKAVIK